MTWRPGCRSRPARTLPHVPDRSEPLRGELLLAQPLDGPGHALAQPDPRLPAELAARLLDRRPAPLDVDLVGGLVHELELLDVLPALLPDDARQLGDADLLRGGDVEVLVLPCRMRHGGHDAVGDVVHVRERARLTAG